MSQYFRDKTRAYEAQLAEALSVAAPVSEEPTSGGEECIEMASAYLEDGRHFLKQNDLPNALAAFAYGHGWLDAGVRCGVLETTDTELFTI